MGSSELGERGVRAEIVGKNAAESLLSEIKAQGSLDSHMADQLAPFIAIVGGRVELGKISPHLRSNCYVIEKFLGEKLKIDEEKKLLFTP